MKLKVTSVRGRRYVDCSTSDCFPDGFWEPGKVNFRTVDEFPVESLPQAEFEQFGHATAYSVAGLSLRSARERFGPVKKGDVVEVEPRSTRRNRAMRKSGTFQVYV